MPRAGAIFVLSLLVALVCPVSAPAAEPPWLEIHSAHFTVVTDAGDKKGREIAFRFEQMRAVFASLLTKDRLNQPVPVTILAFKNDKNYYQAAPLRNGQPIDVPGFFLAGEDQHFFVLNLTEEEAWHAVAGDFAHMLLNYNYPPAQEWFDEGLCAYFASIRLDNRQVEIGGDPQASYAQKSAANQNANSPKSFTETLGSPDWLPLPQLFAMKQEASADNASRQSFFPAESWIVMHYLLHEKKLPETGSYFDQVLNQHVIVEDAIQKAYGVTSEQLEQSIKGYFHSQTAAAGQADSGQRQTPETSPSALASRFPTPVGADDSAMVSKPLPEADARALYAEVQVRIPERREFGLKTLRELATTPTAADKKAEGKAESKTEKKPDDEEGTQLPSTAIGSALAHRILAWDHILHNEFDEALSELSAAAALNRSDMWVRYYLSVLKYRIAQVKHAEIRGLANMMIDLKAVLEWYPEMADAYDLLAVARNEGGGAPAAMQAERAAMALSPRDERYVYHMALIYIAAKKWEAAENLLERLRASTNPEIATLAREQLSQMGNERRFGHAEPGSGTTQSNLAPQKSPFDVLEEDAAKRAAAEKAGQPAGLGDKRATKFLRGRLVRVDCSQPPAATVTVTAEGASLKLRTPDYKSVLLIGADQFSCAWQNLQVSVNYKPGGSADGDLVSLEVR